MTGRPGSRHLLLLLVLAAVLLAPAAGASVARRDTKPFAGLGTWIDVYNKRLMAEPEHDVAVMARHGVRTLYLETGNYRHSVDLVRPLALGSLVDAAHVAHIRVVAWYLPSLANLKRDKRRILAAVDFRSPSGGSFDGFALDIEATSVRQQALRNRRLVELSKWLRASAGAGYPLGAITPSPVGMSPSYWPTLPYRKLVPYYDAFLPMAYSTMRGLRGRAATQAYLTATVAAIRARSGDRRLPIHLIGGLSGGMGAGEVAGFLLAVKATRPIGYSLYPFRHTRPSAWKALAAHTL